MSPPAAIAADTAAPAQTSLRPFRTGFWFGGFNGLTWMVGLGTPMVLMAQQLGATTFQVGLVSSFVFLLMPLQVLSTQTLPRLGYKRQMVSAWAARGTFLGIPLGLAVLAPTNIQPWMPALFVASVFGFCFFRALGVAAHVPWFTSVIPDSMRGRFFATDHAITSVVGVVTLLGCAAVFAQWPGFPALRIVYAVAVLGSMLAVLFLLRMPTAPPPDPMSLGDLAAVARNLVLEPGLFRHYLVLTLTGSVVTTSMAAFTAYLKVEVGLDSSRILALTAMQFAGQIAGTGAIRRWIDRIAVRRFFQASNVAIAVVDAYWLAVVGGVGGALAFLPAAYFVFGLSVGVSNATHYTYLPELSDERRRPVSVAVFLAVQGLLAGLAPIAWGLALKPAGPAPGVDAGGFLAYFALGAFVSLALIVLYASLPDGRAAVAERTAARAEPPLSASLGGSRVPPSRPPTSA